MAGDFSELAVELLLIRLKTLSHPYIGMVVRNGFCPLFEADKTLPV
jgi:hypothetical protein